MGLRLLRGARGWGFFPVSLVRQTSSPHASRHLFPSAPPLTSSHRSAHGAVSAFCHVPGAPLSGPLQSMLSDKLLASRGNSSSSGSSRLQGVVSVSMSLLWGQRAVYKDVSLKVHHGSAEQWAMQANDQVLSNTQRPLAYFPE